jgi:hypothetical protein
MAVDFAAGYYSRGCKNSIAAAHNEALVRNRQKEGTLITCTDGEFQLVHLDPAECRTPSKAKRNSIFHNANNLLACYVS